MANIQKKDYITFFLTFSACFVSVYLLPAILNKIFFIVIFFFVIKSRKDYFWYAIFFVLICTPGSLFFGESGEMEHRLPLIKIISGVSFSVFDLFLIIMTFKAFRSGKNNPMLMKKMFSILGLLYALYFLYSLLLGMDLNNLIAFFRRTFFFTLLISAPKLMSEPEDMYRFVHLIFPTTFIVIIGAFSQMIFGMRLIDRWVGQESNTNFTFAKMTNELYNRPNLYGIILIYFSIIFGLYYFSRKDYRGNKIYLLIIIIISFLTVVISQTRGWIGSSILIIILFFLFVQKMTANAFLYIIFGLSIIFIGYSGITPLRIAVNNGISRFSTVESIAEGDITAEGTNVRFSERLPIVMRGVSESPIIGLGFSDEYRKYADYHVGFATMLLQIGILGYLFFIIFWVNFYSLIFITNKSINQRNPIKGSLLMYSISFSGCLLMHFTSYQFMGFEYMGPQDFFFICLFFVFADTSLKEARLIESQLKLMKTLNIRKSRKVNPLTTVV